MGRARYRGLLRESEGHAINRWLGGRSPRGHPSNAVLQTGAAHSGSEGDNACAVGRPARLNECVAVTVRNADTTRG